MTSKSSQRSGSFSISPRRLHVLNVLAAGLLRAAATCQRWRKSASMRGGSLGMKGRHLDRVDDANRAPIH